MIRQPFYLLNTAMADLSLFQRNEVKAGRPLTVPGQPHEELGGGRPNQQQQRDRHCLLAVDGLLRMIRPNQHRAGLKES